MIANFLYLFLISSFIEHFTSPGLVHLNIQVYIYIVLIKTKVSLKECAVHKSFCSWWIIQDLRLERFEGALQCPLLVGLGFVLVVHTQKLISQIVQPQHIGMGVIHGPAVTEKQRMKKEQWESSILHLELKNCNYLSVWGWSTHLFSFFIRR